MRDLSWYSSGVIRDIVLKVFIHCNRLDAGGEVPRPTWYNSGEALPRAESGSDRRRPWEPEVTVAGACAQAVRWRYPHLRP